MKVKYFIVAILVSGLCLPLFGLAGYNPDDIISDRLYYSSTSMNKSDIQNFLAGYGSYLASYTVGGKKAADLIYESCRTYGISPKVMLTMLQKEQSLIESSSPSQSALDCATGYGSCDPKYKGFDVQVGKAAWVLGKYYDENKGSYAYDVGKTTVTQDGVAVTPENRATADLFIYNPVAGTEKGNGNFLFWTLYWNRYFDADFMTGTLIRERGDQGVYLVGTDGRKHGFWGSAAFSQTYRPDQVIEVDASDVVGLGTGDPIKLRDGVVFRSPNGAVFISDDTKRRGVPNQETLHDLGYSNRDPIDVSWTEVNLLPEGAKFNDKDLDRPDGAFIKTAENPAVYLIDEGKKRPFWGKEILDFNYNGQILVVDISQKELDSYPVGPPVGFRDGALLQSKETGGIYVIANGQKYGIPSMDAFKNFGYEMANVIPVSNKLLSIHPDGGTAGGFSELP
ncbi:hypothetical protein ACFL0Z_02025 [Patescibacteria group bacterium]